MRAWLRDAVETDRFGPTSDPIDQVALLERLTQVEGFEQFLQRNFPGKTRFSIEGLDMMVPMLDEMIAYAAEAGIYDILLGMAHRGRLNVLAHHLQQTLPRDAARIQRPADQRNLDRALSQVGWTGDVKYHAGAHVPFAIRRRD